MHDIQKQILGQLVLRSPARYADLKPRELEGNLFTYHLRRVMTDGYIEKTANRYVLTPAGARYADQLSLKTLTPRIQPKIVTLLAIANTAGEWLLYRRTREPFRGLVGFPYGKIHLGERIAVAAARELTEKTGLTAALDHRGELYLTVRQGSELVSHMLAHVFVGREPTGQLTPESPIGRCFWQNVSHLDPAETFPGFLDLLTLIETTPTNQRFFEERDYSI